MNGKGGTGKSSICAFLIAHIIENALGSVLAIDADPNSCLPESLGVKEPETIVGTCDEISKNLSKIPAGITKDRFIEMRVQEAVNEAKGFDLLVMGRPEGPGCYCYVNNLLRGIVGDIAKGYDFVIIDNAAGMEHISRRTTAELNKLLIVSDYSIPGVRSARRIYDLARQLGIKFSGAYLVVNKVTGPVEPLAKEIGRTGLGVAGTVPYDEGMVDWNISNKPIFDFHNETIRGEIANIFNNLMR
ncbi:MAG: AAA family ATPase [Candidatus Omnitrophica bacterium]|nr:AAA family ATPase [Candidatus Omnitrophota bacterium]